MGVQHGPETNLAGILKTLIFGAQIYVIFGIDLWLLSGVVSDPGRGAANSQYPLGQGWF